MLGVITLFSVVGFFSGRHGSKMDGPVMRSAVPLTRPVKLCRSRVSIERCRTVDEIEKLLVDPDLEIVGVAPTPSGAQGARVLTLRAPGRAPVVFRAKWRAYADASRRNSPRRELGTYAVQRLFLRAHEVVVPPTAPHCFPLDAYRATVDPDAAPIRADVPCVLGVLGYWLEDVQSLADAEEAGWFHGEGGNAFDPLLFERNRRYRDSMSALNLVTHLIAHADGYPMNFVITADRRRPVVYSVDNNRSLGLTKDRSLDRDDDWSRLRLPALRRRHVERLRAALGPDLDRLAVIVELEPRDGRLVPVPTAATDPTAAGEAWHEGRLRLGLTRAEIDSVRGRIAALLERVDRGEVRVY
jgi:hypothetical protein